jgi:mRNA interferase MazF
MNRILKGEIYLAELSPTIGSEISKKRPVLIVSSDISNQFSATVSSDISNQFSATVSIVPITSTTSKIYPFEVFLPKSEGNLINDSKAKGNQIRTIDKLRIQKKFGKISNEKLKEVERAILIHLDINI